MMSFIRPRLRKPLLGLIAGTVFAAAWIVRGGPTWWFSIVVEVVILVRVTTIYVRAAQDSDDGALAGSRADERVDLISLRSWALSGKLAILGAFAGLTLAIALKAAVWWPFAVMLAVIGFGYLLGLSTFGVPDEGPADEASPRHEAPSPVS
jgi:hypothetical protein